MTAFMSSSSASLSSSLKSCMAAASASAKNSNEVNVNVNSRMIMKKSDNDDDDNDENDNDDNDSNSSSSSSSNSSDSDSEGNSSSNERNSKNDDDDDDDDDDDQKSSHENSENGNENDNGNGNESDKESEKDEKESDDDDDDDKNDKKNTDDDDDDEDDENEIACPICLSSCKQTNNTNNNNDNNNNNDTVLAHGPCGHDCCRNCWEYLLNANAEPRHEVKSYADIHLSSAPTLGRCPICRMELSLFQLRKTTTKRTKVQTKTATAITTTQESTSDNEQQQQQEDTEEQEEELLYPPCVDYFSNLWIDCPLLDTVYIPYRGKIGQLSFHWDWNKLKRNVHSIERPFINATDAIQKNPNHWRLDRTKQFIPAILFFEEGCHFHAPSRTFHGTISFMNKFQSRLNGSHTWDIVLGFPKDYRFLSTGRIHMLKDYVPKNNHNDWDHLPKHFTQEQRQLCRYPFDGRWTVTWTTKQNNNNNNNNNNTNKDNRTEIHVKNNEYQQSGWPFYIDIDPNDPDHPTIYWPRSKHYQRIMSGVDLTNEPMGPTVGAKIHWKATSPNFDTITWERQTIGPVPPIPKVIQFGMGTGKMLYQKLNAKTSDQIPKYHVDTLWGNIFCKRLHVGSASYHFLSPTNSYISYQHPACRDLPPLDDGTPMPTRVDFHNLEYDEQERKVTATIEWENDFGTSWNDNVKWTLTMYFDTQYMIIIKGGIQCEWCHERRARPRPPRPRNQYRPPPVPVYVPPPTPPTPEEEEKEEEKQEETPAPAPTPAPERNEEWVMSGYGHDQLYINAAILERYRSSNDNNNNNDNNGDNDTTTTTTTTTVIDYNKLGQEHCQRLEQEGATQRSIDIVKYVFQQAAEKPNSNPIDFLLT